VDLAKAKAAAALATANASAKPVAHPIVSTNITIAKMQKPLATIAVISFILLAVSIGLAFTALSVISKIAVPVTGSVAVLSFGGVIALPFLPWVIGGASVVAVGLIVYEIIRYKGSVTSVVQAVKKDLGITSSTAVPAVPHSSTVSSTVVPA